MPTLVRTRALAAIAPLLLLLGCPEEGGITTAPNTAPNIQLLLPEPDPDGEPIQVLPEGQILFQASVTDAEDATADLIIHWTAERLDNLEPATELEDTTADSDGLSDNWISGLDPGVWSIQAVVVDTDGATDQQAAQVEFLGENLPPGCTITQPATADEYIEGEVITFTGTVNDDRGFGQVSVEWFSNIDGLLDITPPTSSGLLTFSRNNLTPGEHTVNLTATDDDGAACETLVAFLVTPDDLPPTDPEVRIIPDDPVTLDDLTCTIFQGSADPDGEPITYTYAWYRNGNPTLVVGDLVTSDQTEALDEWTCQVVASDGTLNSNVASDSVTITNSGPTVDEALLTPDVAYETTTLTCAGIGWFDDDGDAEAYDVVWNVGGVPVPASTMTLDGTWFDRDEPVFCELTPNDGFETGAPVISNVITILNSAPEPPTLLLDPAPLATQDQDITCTLDIDATDVDGDVILVPDSYEITWLIDGVYDPTSDGLWIIPEVRTGLGEEWTCQVRAFDGTEWSALATAATEVLPLEGDLVLTEFLANPDGVADVAGEWIELYNASSLEIDLQGFELHDDTGDSHEITDSMLVPAGTRIVLSRNGDYVSNGSVFAAYEYSNFSLGNGADEIVISFGGVEIDRFEYDMTLYSGGLPGHALALDTAISPPDPIANDDPNNWCLAGNPIAGPGTDFGTPGGANDGCACFASDGDGDGYGDDASCTFADCNDADPNFSPVAPDICENGLDEDCDGVDAICPCLDTDGDGDGFGDGLACNPADCNDADATIFPGQIEACDTVDESCSGVADDGDPAVMCPPTTEAFVTACGGGDCLITECNPGFFDVDTVYSTGCECGDDAIGSTCATALDLGVFNAGDSTTVSGRLPVTSSEDWVRVSFPASFGRPGAGAPHVELTAIPDSSYKIEVRSECSAAPSCSDATSFDFVDDQSSGYTINNTPWPEDLYIRILRTSTAPQCTDWELTVSR
jgi:hypothetical protein